MSFDPNHYVADGLDAFASAWESEFSDYWGLEATRCPEHLSEGDWKQAQLLYSVAGAFHDAALQLEPGDVDVDRIIEILNKAQGEDPRNNELINQSLDVFFARQVGDLVYERRRKSIKLLDVLVESTSHRSREYLLRLARCYLDGMDAEGGVMARAVLDAALQDLVDDDEVLSKGNAAHSRRVDLHDRLKHLKRERLISRDIWEAADFVRQNGNDAVHLAPGAAVSLDIVLPKLRSVFDALEDLRPE